MRLGAAVITSNVTSLPEVAGDAGILIDPLKEDEISSAMLQLLNDSHLRESLKQKALVQAARFSWKNAAKRVLEIYSQVMKS